MHGCDGIGWVAVLVAWPIFLPSCASATDPLPFGEQYPQLDSEAAGPWWMGESPRLVVPRDQVIAFALYTHDHGVLKLTAQLYPLLPREARDVRLELQREDTWEQVDAKPVQELGWSAHFRLEDWDATRDVRYRLRHGPSATWEGRIRRDPIDRPTIVVASLSCNSSRTPGPRTEMVDNLLRQDPDVLFFAGDQSYHHTQHTLGWLEFGTQFRELLRDRPTITIPDDHDVGQSNLWGEAGKVSRTAAGHDGGYFFPPEYVNMVQRCQTWHLPDPYDATPIRRGIGVYYTRLRVGGIDFAIVEDRKFKSGPGGKIPPMGPRPDHITDPQYDRGSVDLPGLQLLGERQLEFLHEWGQDWTGAEMKCVLSQTAFCGAVHLHGEQANRLVADLDCNGWPPAGRRRALTEIRRAWAVHLCGDQHLAVAVKHGIDAHGDGPYGCTSPAIVNTIYGRWWHPKNEQAGPHAVVGSPLPWTGDYEDGFGNLITMLAYANPTNRQDERQRSDGYGLVRFHKPDRRITFECWPRFADSRQGDAAQFPGWPFTVRMEDNDGRKAAAWLPELLVHGSDRPVIQVVEEANQELLYTVRAESSSFRPRVYRPGTYTINVGIDRPTAVSIRQVAAESKHSMSRLNVDL